jgi:hypothetical protein
VRVTTGRLDSPLTTLGATAGLARAALGKRGLVAWWCDPTIDFAIDKPQVFGRSWPSDELFGIEDVAYFADGAVWRAARTAAGVRWVLIEEVEIDEPETPPAKIYHARIVQTPTRLHNDGTRFSGAMTGEGHVLLREWRVDDQSLGFTIAEIH